MDWPALSAGFSFIWVAKKQVSSRQLRAELLARCNVMAGSKFAYVADLLHDTCQRRAVRWGDSAPAVIPLPALGWGHHP